MLNIKDNLMEKHEPCMYTIRDRWPVNLFQNNMAQRWQDRIMT